MLTREHLLASMRHETKIIQHLASKISADQLAYRPSEEQRSIGELLNYLTLCAWLPALGLVNGNWDHVGELNEEADAVTPETFAAAMDRQMERLEGLLMSFSEEDLAEREGALPWGAPTRFGIGFVDMCLKSLTAYRMNLFLWVKASGRPELSTFQCWVGVDPPAPPAE